MSRFYASIKGSRGEATRQGTPKSGITGHVRGWDFGIKVVGQDIDGTDKFWVYLTSGSSDKGKDKFIGTFTAEDLET